MSRKTHYPFQWMMADADPDPKRVTMDSSGVMVAERIIRPKTHIMAKTDVTLLVLPGVP